MRMILMSYADPLHLAVGFTILIFLYLFLIKEIAHRTVVAMFFAAVTIIANIVLRFTDFKSFIDAVNLDTILLLMSMMIIVGIMSETGVFSYLAELVTLKLYRKPFTMLAVLGLVTAIISAFIDNVTTVLMITPIVLEISRKLKVDARPLLLGIVFASNIGGTATLIGDPPNIIIGTAAGLGFMDFIYSLTPPVFIAFLAYLFTLRVLFASWLKDYRERVKGITFSVRGFDIVRKGLLLKVLVVFVTVVTLFFLEDVFNYSPAIPPLMGAGILLIAAKDVINIDDALKKVDWTTLVFFIGMFIVIRGVQDLGVMDFIAKELASAGGSYIVLLTLIIWVSAMVSAFVDNIPFVMSMIPVIPIL
ncbi:MAG: anion permease, partial [Desulfurococcales archaeon]|nr:anion permease [Desulfurococcales archaeon]